MFKNFLKKIKFYFVLHFSFVLLIFLSSEVFAQGYNRASKVEVKKVIEKTVSETTTIQGRIKLQKPFSVSAEFSAKTILYDISKGDFISKDQKIAKQNIDNIEVQKKIHDLKLKELYLKLKELEESINFENKLKSINDKQVELIHKKFKRSQNLYNRSTISKESLDSVEQMFLKTQELVVQNDRNIVKNLSELEKINFDIKVLKLQINELKTKIGSSIIKSPIDGQLIELLNEKQTYVREGEIIAEIQPLSYFEVEADVPTEFINPIKSSQIVSGRIKNDQNIKLSFKTVYPFEKIQSGSRTSIFRIVGKINENFRARNTPVQLNIPTTIPKKVLLVPKDALIPVPNGHIVYIAEENKAKRKIVKLGGNFENFVIVKSGINKGEVVITKGNEILSDGMKISIMSNNRKKKFNKSKKYKKK